MAEVAAGPLDNIAAGFYRVGQSRTLLLPHPDATQGSGAFATAALPSSNQNTRHCHLCCCPPNPNPAHFARAGPIGSGMGVINSAWSLGQVIMPLFGGGGGGGAGEQARGDGGFGMVIRSDPATGDAFIESFQAGRAGRMR